MEPGWEYYPYQPGIESLVQTIVRDPVADPEGGCSNRSYWTYIYLLVAQNICPFYHNI